jgi:hypothetical protein
MKDLELSKKVWEIVDEIKKDSEKGYEYFIQSHKNIPDESYDVFSIELTKMCFTNLSESGYTNPTSIALNKVILYLSNAKQKINPIVKIKFNETDNITIKSFVKYFSLLRIEGKLTNTINELSEIIIFYKPFFFNRFDIMVMTQPLETIMEFSRSLKCDAALLCPLFDELVALISVIGSFFFF